MTQREIVEKKISVFDLVFDKIKDLPRKYWNIDLDGSEFKTIFKGLEIRIIYQPDFNEEPQLFVKNTRFTDRRIISITERLLADKKRDFDSELMDDLNEIENIFSQ